MKRTLGSLEGSMEFSKKHNALNISTWNFAEIAIEIFQCYHNAERAMGAINLDNGQRQFSRR